MQYKTIALHLLEQNPEMYDQLRTNRTLLPTMERYAEELRMAHLLWMDEGMGSSEAMEIAVKELEGRLSAGPLSLNDAMEFIQHSPPA
jgi:hypothetical protein